MHVEDKGCLDSLGELFLENMHRKFGRELG